MKMVSKKATEKRATSAHPLSLGARIVRATLPVFLCSLPFLSQAQTPLKTDNEFLVNTYTQGSQSSSVLSRLTDGKFVAVWQSAGQDGSGTGIYAQLYDVAGAPIGTEFRVNTTTFDSQTSPSLATLNDGSFVVVWRNSSDGGPGGETISAQRFDENGSKLGSEIRVQSSPAEYIENVSIAPLDNGGFVVGWGQMQFGYRTYAQVYNADGSTAGSKITGKSDSRDAQVVATQGGFMLIAHESNRLFGQRYLVSGETNGTEFFISENSGYSQSGATISRLSNNDLLIAWESLNQDGSSFGVYARRFNADATTQGAEFRVNTVTQNGQFNPTSTPLDNGGYVVSWQSSEQDGSQEGIYAQAFNSDDSRNGSEFLVNSTTENRQIVPAISAISNNNFVVSWSGRLASGDYNIYAQRFQLETIQADTMTLSMPQSTVLQGDVITLPLHVSGNDIYGLDAVVSLSDTTKARISGGEYGEFLPSDERLSVPMGVNDNQWDGALALMAPATAKSGDGDFASVTLVAEQAGTVNLTLQAQMTDQQGNYLLQNSTDYAFTIAESVTLTGNISSLSTAGDYAFVTLLINGQPVTINPDGSFSVRVGLGDVTMALSAPGYLTAEKQVNLATGQADIDFGQINLVGGDSNGDNHIDIADLTLLLGAYRSVEGEQNGYVMAADFNRDGAINLRDLTLLGANFGKQGPQSW
ncbi:dockerin type I domain-containing protein [Pseudoalteromonas sp. R3]|uniref:dockerin type I domain-containing protein n=1 Tax=Pseudoalteromonas sp. R3 TaxID=1709477 RepID=UPI000FDD3C02|nr:dockerin type I domain-containing protein [Pseudoalteromonas sp. R3]AZZ99255.1 hypothetical protein ELR70_20545 [Pseudoalteromonas sp. R3]